MSKQTAVLTVGYQLRNIVREKLATLDLEVTEYRVIGQPEAPTTFHIAGSPEALAFVRGVCERYNSHSNPPQKPSWLARWRNRKTAAVTKAAPVTGSSITVGGFTTRIGPS